MCSREQSANNKACASCGFEVGLLSLSFVPFIFSSSLSLLSPFFLILFLSQFTRKNHQHWEGGQGCRDKSKLSRKDKKKFSNSENKTKSGKARRVGQKATSKKKS
jgi:hypothetical protein